MEKAKEIKKLRDAVRYHRDQKGDDRCWLDDDRVWALLPDAPPKHDHLPPYEEMMKKCGAFYRYRRTEIPDPEPMGAITDPKEWDSDLILMTQEELEGELLRIRAAVRTHREINGRERTVDDDRELYSILPERLPADFRLPLESDFLGEAKAPHAGCPSFWRSHETCAAGAHDMHTWGPC